GRGGGGRVDGLGVAVRLNVTAARFSPGAGVELSDGGFQPAGLVVVAAGVRAETTLARQAGLEVNHGIVVDDELRSVTDPRVRAIGECAEHRGTVHRLGAPGWGPAPPPAAPLTRA